MLPTILSFTRDPVANLRFNVAKSLERLAPRLEPAIVAGVVRPALVALAADADADVRFYAARALSVC